MGEPRQTGGTKRHEREAYLFEFVQANMSAPRCIGCGMTKISCIARNYCLFFADAVFGAAGAL